MKVKFSKKLTKENLIKMINKEIANIKESEKKQRHQGFELEAGETPEEFKKKAEKEEKERKERAQAKGKRLAGGVNEGNMNRLHIEIQNELEIVMEKFGIGLGDLEGVIMDMKAAEPAQDAGFPKISDFGATPEQIAMLPPKGMNEAYGGDMGDYLGGGDEPDYKDWVHTVQELLYEAAHLIEENGSDPELTDAYLQLMRAAQAGGLNMKYFMMSL